MQKKYNFSLYKNIILSDFFILPINKNLLNNNTKNFYYINIIEILKELKQFVRNIQYLKTKKNSEFLFNTKNKYYLNLLQKYFNVSTVADIKLTVASKITINKSIKDFNKNKMILFLDNLNKNLNNLEIKSLMDNKFYLIHLFNLNFKNLDSGVYSFFNELSTLKKFILITTLINSTIKKNN